MSIARASAIMIVTLVASRVLGWLRLSVIGAHFGETPELDAFWAAFKIPDAIFGLVVAGALASAFIPVFTSYLAREREDEAWHVASSVMNAVLLLLVGFSVVMWVAAPYVVPTFVAPFHDPKQIALTVDLTRIMLLSPIFMGLSSLTTGILNSYRQFLSSATAPLVYNLVIILFTQFGYPFLGIHAVAIGVVDGAGLREPTAPAPARRLLHRDQCRGLSDAVALRLAWTGGPHARYGAAGDPLDPVPHAADGDR